MTPTGLEPDEVSVIVANDLGKPQGQTGAKSGALSVLTAEIDPALCVVVEAWTELPPSARMAIETIVQAALVTSQREAIE